MNPLILLLIREVLMPELVALIKAKQAAGEPLTEEALFAEFGVRLARLITVGETWLAQHPAGG
jgi:hypothetical protein